VSNPRTAGASSVREQKLARVIDREVAPIWHDRFARLLLRELPNNPELFALDVHSGPGHTTAELLQRLDESSRVVALGRDPWLMQVAKTRVKPEWKRRVYFKAGDIDDVTGMNDDTYDLTLANLVLGEQVVEWQPALAELMRVTKPGGQVAVTLPLSGTWQEVEDLFEEMLRDEGMRKEVATLQQLRRRRPKPSQLVAGAREIGLSDTDFIIEHERFELLFRSGREFLFAPVIEHGPLRLWKAILGRAEKPQALFWRFKEAIDTYYAGRVLSVTVIAGLVRLRVPAGAGGPAEDFAAAYWARYPSLSRAWGLAATEPATAAAAGEDEDFDIDLDEGEASDDDDEPSDSVTRLVESGESGAGLDDGFGRGFEDLEVSGANELPSLDAAPLPSDDDDDPFAGLLDELAVEAAARAEVAAEDAEAEAVVQPTKHAPTGRMQTLGDVGDEPEPAEVSKPAPRATKPAAKPAEAPKPAAAAARPSPKVEPPRAGDSGLGAKPSLKPGESGVGSIPKPAPKPAVPPRVDSSVGPKPAAPPRADSSVGPKPAGPAKVDSAVGPAPKPASGMAARPAPSVGPAAKPAVAPPPVASGAVPPVASPPKTAAPKRSDSGITPIPAPPKRSDSSITPIPASPKRSDSSITPIPPAAAKPAVPPPPVGGGSLASKLPPRLPPRPDRPDTPLIAPPRSPGDSGTGSLLSRLPRRTPSDGTAASKPAASKPTASKPTGSKPTGPVPQVTKPGEDDPFAALLDDDALELEELDDIDEVPGNSLMHGELDEDDDLADSFGPVVPDPSSGSSGARPLGTPRPPKKK
jgi:ubiquinone/menaquinone biosynthesis C-methylase UbiE